MNKIKGIIYYEIEGKTYGIDLNNHCYIGTKGKPIKSTPPKTSQYMRNYFNINNNNENMRKYDVGIFISRCFYKGFNLKEIFMHYTYRIQLWEKLDAINFQYNLDFPSENTCAFVCNNFQKFLQWVKQNANEGTICIDCSAFQRELKKKEWKKSIQLANRSQYPEEFMDFLYNYFRETPSKYLNRVVWFILQNGIYDMWKTEREEDDISYDLLAFGRIYEVLNRIVKLASLLQLDNIPKGNLGFIYRQLVKTYVTKKREIQTNQLKENQLNRNLEFSFGDFIVIVPITPKEFEEEADQQSNCVYSSYLRRVVEGVTNVVFIRHKDKLEKSVITCEICNGQIRQFLLAHNQHIEYSHNYIDLANFKSAYQEHLNNNFIQ